MGHERTSSPQLPSWPPRVQVAGVSSLEEALFCKSVGVDAIGFTLELPTGVHDGLTVEKAAAIVSALPEGLLPVLITYLTRADGTCRLADRVGAAAVQFHGGISQEELRVFRRECPGTFTIGRVTVSGDDALSEAVRFTPPLWDAIILDSLDPATRRIGATGLTHDWSISARIVDSVSVPVILAGGLTPENVAAAIQVARPAGVDAHTGLEDADGRRNFSKIAAFSRASLSAFASLGLHVPKT
jgi:phosphoribosylanthranilate isomerase